jgi:pyrimidine-nucleoside phosphorylase
MRITDIIRNKQLGKMLSSEEIDYFIRGYTEGTVPDYQAAALCMSIWFNGMSEKETADLTMAMANSGDQIDLSNIDGITVDKHSSGGVADTTTIAVAPLVAACGGIVAKMSGRGLMHSGGTIDKLESIPGYRVNQPMERFVEIVNTCGASIIGQSADLAPADKQLYALRDVTSTVDSLPLIASSIMSKKLASGCDKILLDVKWGTGAFMHSVEDAVRLARTMTSIGEHAGIPTRALVTDMNQPLGNAVGNALEVEEAIRILRGEITGDLDELIRELSAQMLMLSDVYETREQALDAVQSAVESGKAARKLEQMIELHGGNPAVVEDLSLLPKAKQTVSLRAETSGYVTSMQTDEIGMAAVIIGAGREKKGDPIDPAVGCWLKKRIGDPVEKGEELVRFYVNDTSNVDAALMRCADALHIGEERQILKIRLVEKIIGENRSPDPDFS